MAYTPINWAENSDVTAVKLDQMDSQIDTNENDLRGHDSDISNLDGRIDGNDSDIANNEGKILTNENNITDINNKSSGTATDDLQSQINNIDGGTNPVALAEALTSGLDNVKFDIGSNNNVYPNTTVNLPFTADYVLLSWGTFDNTTLGVRFETYYNVSSFTVPDYNGENSSYGYIAIKRN